MIQRKRRWCCNATNVGEQGRQEGLCPYQMGGEAFRHSRKVFGVICLQDGFVRLWPDSLSICLVSMTRQLDGHVRFITARPCILLCDGFLSSNYHVRCCLVPPTLPMNSWPTLSHSPLTTPLLPYCTRRWVILSPLRI
jgi:hypothetical protein